MAAILMHRSGAHTSFEGDHDLDALVDELSEPPDPEHPDVAVTHESGWTLSAYPTGRLIWENVESDDPPRHAHVPNRQEIRRLFGRLALGHVGDVEALDWRPVS